ncbi:unnamed protein product [Gordionus sp. m RMFG-2023]|uniref:FAD-linked sulfhydryl oxidase ALR-like n=1 Tax=Gordionus sp. m RMFG-2023 TaxID=3053472 RepID=UPI0030DE2230
MNQHYGEKGRICKACSEFKNLMKSNISSSNPNIITHTKRDDCPLDVNELGKVSWSFLHTLAAYYPKEPSNEDKKDMETFINLVAKFYPCDICAEDFKNQIKRNFPKLKSQFDLSMWLCQIHNEINERLNKPRFDCSKVFQRWRDGWNDKSCD